MVMTHINCIPAPSSTCRQLPCKTSSPATVYCFGNVGLGVGRAVWIHNGSCKLHWLPESHVCPNPSLQEGLFWFGRKKQTIWLLCSVLNLSYLMFNWELYLLWFGLIDVNIGVCILKKTESEYQKTTSWAILCARCLCWCAFIMPPHWGSSGEKWSI